MLHPTPKTIRFLLAVVALWVNLLAGPAGADESADRARLKKQIARNPTLQITYWGLDWRDQPLSRRIRPAPEVLVQKIRLENQLAGFKETPVPVPPPPEIALAFASILERLPDTLHRILATRFIGIFTVNQLGGTGYSEVVYNRAREEYYGIIVVDAGILQQKRANAWATWKINSMFKPVPGSPVRVRAVMEPDPADTTVNAIRFILLHEIGHILGMATRVHPSWLAWQAGEPLRRVNGFPGLSWQPSPANRLASRFDDRFPERKKIKAYAFENAGLTVSQIPATYTHLEQHSNFPTLYACESPWEDFAESFATYFHVVIDQRPWQIIIEQAGHPDRVIGACWRTPRCREKTRFLNAWFENPLEKRE